MSLACQRCHSSFERPGSRGAIPRNCPACARAVRQEQEIARAAAASYPRSDAPKACPRCERTLPASAFGALKRALDGLQVYCRECKRGYHVASYRPKPRRVAKHREAVNAARRERWANDASYRQRKTALKAGSYAMNRQRTLAQQSEYRSANRDKRRAANAAWRAANADRKRALNRAHFQANKHRWRAYGAARKAAKLRATPGWFERQAIAAFYAACPDGFHVDHMVPLQSSLVCGLHCLANLQYLRIKENLSKRNHWWPAMPDREVACRL